MKKFILSVLLLATLAVNARAGALVHFTQRLVTGTYLYVTNASTLTTGSTNNWYYSYSAGTNVLSGATNTFGNLQPAPLSDAILFPDMNADVNPNLAVQVVVGYTNNLFLQGVQTPVMLNTVWTNPTPAIAGTLTQTNTLVFTFTPIGSGDFGLPDTGAVTGKSFSFTVIQTNMTPQVLTTNLPTYVLQGAYGLRCSVTNSAGAIGGGAVINGINLVGWKP